MKKGGEKKKKMKEESEKVPEPVTGETLERYYRRNCEKGSMVAHGDAAENGGEERVPLSAAKKNSSPRLSRYLRGNG